MIGNRIKLARLANSLSLQELADALEERGYKITRAALSKFETGKLVPSPALIRLLAHTLGVGIGFFSWEEWPDFGIQLFREKEDLQPKQLTELNAFLQIKLEQTLHINSLLKIAPEPFAFDPTPLPPGSFQPQLDRMVNGLRTRWGNASQPLASVCAMLENNGWCVFELPDIFGTSAVCGRETSSGIPFLAFSHIGTIDDTRCRMLRELSYAYISCGEKEAMYDMAGAFSRAMLLPSACVQEEFDGVTTAPDQTTLTLLKRKYGIPKIQIRMRLREQGLFYSPMSAPKIIEAIQARKLSESKLEVMSFLELPSRLTMNILRARQLELLTQEDADSMLPIQYASGASYNLLF